MDIFGFKGLLLLALVFVPLELLLPAHRRPLVRPQWRTDLLYALLNRFPIGIGLGVLILGITALAERAVPAPVQAWVGSLPFPVQVVAAVVLADLGFYLMHRLFHTPLLWRFHAVHHSIEHLDWLAGHRVHPVDQILTKAGSFLPVFALGFSGEAIAAYGFLYGWHSVLLHSNVRLPFGPLRWIVASPQFHHWHHANHREAWDKNFAGQVAAWDVLFGTYYVPGRSLPERYGTDDPVPDGYVKQLAYPFTAAAAPTTDTTPQASAQKA